MVTIPTVQSFLGFVDLKIACIAIAAFRMFVSIIILILLIVVFLVVEDKVDEVGQFVVSPDAKEEIAKVEFFVAVYLIIVAAVLAINVLATYWFINGANSNNPTNMKYYLMVEVVLIIMCLLMVFYHVASIVPALIECYTLLLSYSLYQECVMGYLQGNAVNSTENTTIRYSNVTAPTPLYNTCEQKTTPETQTQHITANPFRE